MGQMATSYNKQTKSARDTNCPALKNWRTKVVICHQNAGARPVATQHNLQSPTERYQQPKIDKLKHQGWPQVDEVSG